MASSTAAPSVAGESVLGKKERTWYIRLPKCCVEWSCAFPSANSCCFWHRVCNCCDLRVSVLLQALFQLVTGAVLGAVGLTVFIVAVYSIPNSKAKLVDQNASESGLALALVIYQTARWLFTLTSGAIGTVLALSRQGIATYSLRVLRLSRVYLVCCWIILLSDLNPLSYGASSWASTSTAALSGAGFVPLPLDAYFVFLAWSMQRKLHEQKEGVFIGKPVMRSQRKPDHILGLAHVGALNLVLPGTVGRPWPAGAAQAVADEVQPQLVVPSPVQQVMTRSATAAAATPTKLGGSIALPLPVSKGLAVPMDVAAAGGAAAAASVGLVTEEEFELEMLTASSGSIMAGGIIRRDSSVGSSLGRSSLYTVEEQQAGMEDGMEEGQDEEVEEGAAEGALFEDEFEEVEAGEYGEGQVSAGVTAAAGAAGLDVYGQLLGSLPPSGQALPAGSVITEDGVYGGKAAAGAGAGGGAASQPSLAHLLEQQAHVQGASRGSTKPMETVGTASVAASQSSLSSLGYGKSSRTAATVNAAAPPPTPSLGQGAAALGLPQLASRLQLAVAHTTTSVKAEAKGASPPGSKPGTELPSLSIPNWRWPMSALGSKSPAATTLSTAGSHYSYIPSTAPGTTTSLGPPTVSDRAGAGEDGAAAAAPEPAAAAAAAGTQPWRPKGAPPPPLQLPDAERASWLPNPSFAPDVPQHEQLQQQQGLVPSTPGAGLLGAPTPMLGRQAPPATPQGAPAMVRLVSMARRPRDAGLPAGSPQMPHLHQLDMLQEGEELGGPTCEFELRAASAATPRASAAAAAATLKGSRMHALRSSAGGSTLGVPSVARTPAGPGSVGQQSQKRNPVADGASAAVVAGSKLLQRAITGRRGASAAAAHAAGMTSDEDGESDSVWTSPGGPEITPTGNSLAASTAAGPAGLSGAASMLAGSGGPDGAGWPAGVAPGGATPLAAPVVRTTPTAPQLALKRAGAAAGGGPALGRSMTLTGRGERADLSKHLGRVLARMQAQDMGHPELAEGQGEAAGVGPGSKPGSGLDSEVAAAGGPQTPKAAVLAGAPQDGGAVGAAALRGPSLYSGMSAEPHPPSSVAAARLSVTAPQTSHSSFSGAQQPVSARPSSSIPPAAAAAAGAPASLHAANTKLPPGDTVSALQPRPARTLHNKRGSVSEKARLAVSSSYLDPERASRSITAGKQGIAGTVAPAAAAAGPTSAASARAAAAAAAVAAVAASTNSVTSRDGSFGQAERPSSSSWVGNLRTSAGARIGGMATGALKSITAFMSQGASHPAPEDAAPEGRSPASDAPAYGPGPGAGAAAVPAQAAPARVAAGGPFTANMLMSGSATAGGNPRGAQGNKWLQPPAAAAAAARSAPTAARLPGEGAAGQQQQRTQPTRAGLSWSVQALSTGSVGGVYDGAGEDHGEDHEVRTSTSLAQRAGSFLSFLAPKSWATATHGSTSPGAQSPAGMDTAGGFMAAAGAANLEAAHSGPNPPSSVPHTLQQPQQPQLQHLHASPHLPRHQHSHHVHHQLHHAAPKHGPGAAQALGPGPGPGVAKAPPKAALLRHAASQRYSHHHAHAYHPPGTPSGYSFEAASGPAAAAAAWGEGVAGGAGAGTPGALQPRYSAASEGEQQLHQPHSLSSAWASVQQSPGTPRMPSPGQRARRSGLGLHAPRLDTIPSLTDAQIKELMPTTPLSIQQPIPEKGPAAVAAVAAAAAPGKLLSRAATMGRHTLAAASALLIRPARGGAGDHGSDSEEVEPEEGADALHGEVAVGHALGFKDRHSPTGPPRAREQMPRGSQGGFELPMPPPQAVHGSYIHSPHAAASRPSAAAYTRGGAGAGPHGGGAQAAQGPAKRQLHVGFAASEIEPVSLPELRGGSLVVGMAGGGGGFGGRAAARAGAAAAAAGAPLGSAGQASMQVRYMQADAWGSGGGATPGAGMGTAGRGRARAPLFDYAPKS